MKIIVPLYLTPPYTAAAAADTAARMRMSCVRTDATQGVMQILPFGGRG